MKQRTDVGDYDTLEISFPLAPASFQFELYKIFIYHNDLVDSIEIKPVCSIPDKITSLYSILSLLPGQNFIKLFAENSAGQNYTLTKVEWSPSCNNVNCWVLAGTQFLLSKFCLSTFSCFRLYDFWPRSTAIGQLLQLTFTIQAGHC